MSDVKTCTGRIVWEGVTVPDKKDDPTKPKWNMKIAIHPNSPDVQVLNAIATQEMNESTTFKGQWPDGARWPIKPLDPDDLNPEINGFMSISASTRLDPPKVYSMEGQELSVMQYASLLYPGAEVKLAVSCWSYDNKGKGISFNLHGIQIVNSTLPKFKFKTDVDVAAAFGIQPGMAPMAATPPTGAPPVAAAPVAAPPVAAAPVQPHTAFAGGPGAPPVAAPPVAAPPVAAPAAIPGAPGHVMTPAALNTYAEYIGANWTDAMLIQKGYMMPINDVPF